MELRVGILIIGSLLWENKPHRQDWRNRRLDNDESGRARVRAPIRYGRKSGRRSDTYTMVISRDCENGKWGEAVVVGCNHPADSAEKLIEEALDLWRAEQADASMPAHPLGALWGCVGLLENPTGKGIPANWLQEWKSTVAKDRQPPSGLRHAKNERPTVDQDTPD